MLKEWFEYITTNAPEWAKERGLLYESIALKARHQRQNQAWEIHTTQCHEVIRKFVDSVKYARKVMVFGSGHLFDFPMDLIEREHLRFYLVDAVHPKAVIELSQKCPRIELLYWDLSRRPEALWREHFSLMEQMDLLISCNVLSQIPLFRDLNDPSAERMDPLQLAERHLAFISSLHQPGILISDFLRTIKNRDGSILEQQPTIPLLTDPQKSWTWTLAPLGELEKSKSIQLEVGVWTSREIKKYRFNKS